MSRRTDTPPPATGRTEKETLVGFLDYLRTSAAGKVEGVPEPAVRTPGVPSGTNLLGLIRHLSHVERAVFLGEQVRDWSATFQVPDDESADDVVAGYRDAVTRANEAIAACEDLADPVARPAAHGKEPPSMRWALTHMIEETARHAGHLDILRELHDGATGR